MCRDCNRQRLISGAENLRYYFQVRKWNPSFWWSSVSIWTHSMQPDVSLLGGRWSAAHVSNVPLHVMCNSSFFFLPERLPTISSHCFALKQIRLVTVTDFCICRKKRMTENKTLFIISGTEQWWRASSEQAVLILRYWYADGESWFPIPVNSFTNLLQLLLTS